MPEKPQKKHKGSEMLPASSTMNAVKDASLSCRRFESLRVRNYVWDRYTLHPRQTLTTLQYCNQWLEKKFLLGSSTARTLPRREGCYDLMWIPPRRPSRYPPTLNKHVPTIYCAERLDSAAWKHCHCCWVLTKVEQQVDGHFHRLVQQVAHTLTMVLQWPLPTLNHGYTKPSCTHMVGGAICLLHLEVHCSSLTSDVVLRHKTRRPELQTNTVALSLTS